jgi:hypothetical protein
MMQRNPTWLVEVSTGSAWRAAGGQWIAAICREKMQGDPYSLANQASRSALRMSLMSFSV